MQIQVRYFIGFVALFAVGCSTGPIDLSAELAVAQSGDVIEVTAGDYEGNFIVPAGVILEGEEGAVIRGVSGAPALTLIPGRDADSASTVQSLTIYTDEVGVFAAGKGFVNIQNVTVHADLGVGMVLDDCTASVTDVDLVGVVDGPDSPVLMLGEYFESDKVSVMGLAAHLADLTISNLNITGFVGYGAAFYGGTALWDGGVLRWIVGVNIMVEESQLSLENVHIKESLQSRDANAKRSSFGLVSSTGSNTTTNNVTIEDIMGAGVLIHEAVSSVHTTLKVSKCDATGVHVQNGTGHTELIAAEFHQNKNAGLSLLKAGQVDIIDSRVFDTAAVGAQITSSDLVLGHGLQIAAGDANVNMSGVLLEDNEIVGLLLDGDNLDVYAEDVTVGLRDMVCSNDHADCFGVQNQNGASLPDGINVGDSLEDAGAVFGGSVDFPITENQIVQEISKIGEWIPEDDGYVAGNTLQIGETGIQ